MRFSFSLALASALLLLSTDVSRSHGAAPISPAVPTPAVRAVQIIGPERVAIGQLASFRLLGLPQASQPFFDWQIFNKPADAIVLDVADRRTGDPILIFQTTTPGRCALIADINVLPLEDCQLILWEFTVEGSEPQPNPNPEPNPNPTPTPKAVYCVIIEERDDRDDLGPKWAMVFESKQVRDLFAEGKFQVRDPDQTDEHGQTPEEFKEFIDRAKEIRPPLLRYGKYINKQGAEVIGWYNTGLTTPMIFLVAADGQVVFEGALPQTVPETVKLIKEYVK